MKFRVKDNFSWILFLGVLPFDKAALTLYKNEALGEYISLFLNGITLVLAVILLILYQQRASRTKFSKNHIANKFIFFFITILIIYLLSSASEGIKLMRILSIFCLAGYYLFSIYAYNDDCYSLIKNINKAILFLIVLSFIFHIIGNENVTFVENATTRGFKGVSTNRNSFSELSLFFIATNFYLFRENKNHFLYYFITTLIAIYTTILTNGATSIVCMFIMIVMLIFINNRKTRKICSFKVFILGYCCLFVIVIFMQNLNFGIFKIVMESFGKSSTLTGRTDIWNIALKLIKEAPYFGVGFDSNVLLLNGVIENDPHNGLLYITLSQGIFGLLIFVMMLISILKNSDNEKIKDDNAYMTMLIFLMVWFIRGLVESIFSYTHFVFWATLIILELITINVNKRKRS